VRRGRPEYRHLFRSLFDDAIANTRCARQLTLHADRARPDEAKLAPAKAGGDRAAARRPRRHSLAQSPAHLQQPAAAKAGTTRFPKPLQNLEYQPRFPQRFGCIEDARSFCRAFFDWYTRTTTTPGSG